MEPKQYGLIKLSKTDKSINSVKHSIFESDSDSDQSSSEQKSKTYSSSAVKKQTKIDISRALTDDPNVFEYDSIYDEMKSKKESIVENESEKKDKQPRYINHLLKFAQNRKNEQERRIERKIQKEREDEGNTFADKEAFVTNAYKQKLQEMRAAEEIERREQAIEELLDVTKQKDLSGFYRNLLNNNISSDSTNTKVGLSQTQIETQTEAQTETSKPISKPKPYRQIRRRRSSSEESSDSPTHKDDDNIKTVDITQKNDNKSNNNQKERLHSDNESDESSVEDSPKNRSQQSHLKDQNKPKHSVDSPLDIDSERKEQEEKINDNRPKLDKRAILIKKFTKRTVGEVYEAARLRYLERRDKYLSQ